MQTPLKSDILSRIDGIYEAIKHSPMVSTSSIIGGELSKALFYAHYARLKNDDQALNLTMDILRRVSQYFTIMLDGGIAISNGIVGYGWILSYLEEENFLNTGATKILNLIDKTILSKALVQIKQGNYDHLHGALGTGVYFLSRKAGKKNVKALEKMVLAIKKIAINEGEFFKWNHYDYEIKMPVLCQYNLGLSHGMPSIILFLIRCHERGILTEITHKLIIGGVKYLISQHQEGGKGGSYFPYTTTETKELQKSRLAWCYGDLGILYTIVLANKIFAIKGIDPFINQVIEFEVKRKDLKDNQIYDTAFCHGTAGIAHLFKRISELYDHKDLSEITDYWYQQTLNLGNHKDGFAGFKKYSVLTTPKFLNDATLLEGVSGIGLILINSVSPIKEKWDKLFMLS